MKKTQLNIGNSNKWQRIKFAVKLKQAFKKSSMAELQITLAVLTQEIAKRQKGLKK